MKTITDEKELLILELVSKASQPVGSWNLAEQLGEKGILISPATIGRVLSHLERLGYLAKQKFRGRVITSKGVSAIRQAQGARQMAGYKQALDQYINTDITQNYLMVLQARQAIERATAGLAARNILNEEIEQLEEMLRRQEENYSRSESIAQTDIDFHRTIAHASRNHVLETLYVLVSLLGQQSELFEYVRRKVGAPYMVAHRAILDALKRHDAEEAERCMAGHIESLRRDVDTYWHEYDEQK